MFRPLISIGIATIILLISFLSPSTPTGAQRADQLATTAARETGALGAPGIDLDMIYISREPRYNYNEAKQWPDPGEIVTFTAHVINKGVNPAGQFSYEWRIDNQIVSSGIAPGLAPQNEMTRTLSWPWQSGRHTVSFLVDPHNQVIESAENNNVINDFTDAMAIGFWVEDSVYSEFNNHLNSLGTYSWEDWAQTIIQKMNTMFEQSKYPLAPAGGVTRVRLDKVSHAPDGTLFEQGYNHAPIEYATDVQWGFSIEEYQNCSNTCYNAPWWVIHELMHYLYARIDIYAFDVQGGDVFVRDDSNNLIAGTALLPFIHWDVVYYASRSWDLMHNSSGECLFSDYIIYSLNRDWPMGQRNHRSDWYYYFEQLPGETRLRIIDLNGQPMSNVQVSVYQAVWGNGSSGPYSQNYDNTPDITGTTNALGQVSLGSAPFGNLHLYGTPSGILLIKLRHPVSGQSKYTWLELTDINMAYWRGETSLYIHDLYFPEGQKQIRLDRSTLSFQTYHGWDPIPQQVKVDLIGDGTAEWSVSLPTQPWLRTIPSIELDATNYQPGPLTFIIDSDTLPVGSYTDQVQVTSSTMMDSPQIINVNLIVLESKPIFLPLIRKP